MARKLFIVARDQEVLYVTLCRALAGESDVQILYDRRTPARVGRRAAEERRLQFDVGEQIRARGFGVVRLEP
jgi:hypothetical protein